MTDELQFDRAETARSDQPSGAICAACRRPITDQYYAARGQTICRSCRDRITEELGGRRPNWAGALAFGLGGAIAGAVIYFAVAAIANVEIGLVAIAVGWLVGRGMQLGAGPGGTAVPGGAATGGLALQITAAALTYVAVAAAYIAVRVFAAVERLGMSPAAAIEAISGGSPIRLIGLPITSNLSDLPMGAIGLLIVGIGVYQAWRMTAPVRIEFQGPYSIGNPSPGTTG
jgi:hypothetical protein